jgi:hypothetical protein
MNDEESMAETGVADRIRQLEQRLEDMERGSRLREKARSRFDRVVPPEAMQHFRSAGREQLMGVRTLVDHWIGRLEESDKRATQPDRETIEIS